MNKFLSLFNSNKPQQKNTQTDLVEMSESILLDTRLNLENIASKAVGKFIESIPVIKEGPVFHRDASPVQSVSGVHGQSRRMRKSRPIRAGRIPTE